MVSTLVAGPLEVKCLDAGRRARLRPGMAAHLATLGLSDLPLLASLHVPEVALLGAYLHVVPRVTSRWMLDAAASWGLPALLENQEGSREALLERVAGPLGWALDVPEARAAGLGVLDHLAEVGALERRRDGSMAWRGEAGARALVLDAEDEVLAREVFAGTLAFYRACLDGLPAVLRGEPGPLTFEAQFQSLWDGVLGSAEQILLRLLGLRAVGSGARPAHVLDLACGTGFSTALLAEQWPGTAITAIDFTDAAYARVEERTKISAAAIGHPVDLIMAKPWAGWGHALPFPDATFDAVFFPLNDGFVPRHRRAETFAEIRRVLRPGGKLVMVTACLPTGDATGVGWEMRAQTRFHHAVEFAVRGFHGLSTAAEHEAVLREAQFDVASKPWRFAGLVAVVESPPKRF